jgi:catechol 2,3-dioxygenase-like lactoylglutathione lyase family enzyme
MQRLDHVALEVSRMDTAIAFYTGPIGLRLLSDQTEMEHHERFAFLELEGGNLELLQALDDTNAPIPFTPAEQRRSLCPHLALVAENLDEAIARLREANVEIVKGPLEIPGQVKWLYATDPDGNILEFVQWLHS